MEVRQRVGAGVQRAEQPGQEGGAGQLVRGVEPGVARVLASGQRGLQIGRGVVGQGQLGGGELETAMKKGSATGADVAGSNGIGDLSRVSTYMQSLTARKVR